MPGDPRPLSDRNSCAVANGGTSVPEVLAPAKLESICAVVVVPHIREPAHRPAVGNDEEKAQKLSMHPPRGRHDAGQEGIGDTIAVAAGSLSRKTFTGSVVTPYACVGARERKEKPV